MWAKHQVMCSTYYWEAEMSVQAHEILKILPVWTDKYILRFYEFGDVCFKYKLKS